MAHLKRFGLLSLLVGTVAIPTSVIATYLQSTRTPGTYMVLQWLEKMGLVNQPDAPNPVVHLISLFPFLEKLGLAKPTVFITGAPEMTEMSIFALNDGRAIGFLFVLSVLLALISLGAALWAEYRREPTLFSSAGYIFGVLSLSLVRPLMGLVSAFFGIVAVLVLRFQREHQDT